MVVAVLAAPLFGQPSATAMAIALLVAIVIVWHRLDAVFAPDDPARALLRQLAICVGAFATVFTMLLIQLGP